MRSYKIEFTEEELGTINELSNDISKEGNAIIHENPEATMLIEEWKRRLKIYKSILYKIQEAVYEDE